MLVNNKIKGAIYGSINGDIQGLIYEGVKPKYIGYENILKNNFFNQYSDDTEHLLITIKTFIKNKDSSENFNKSFIKEIQKWFFTLPYGIGKATIKSIIKSFFTKKSGVLSQGNGALMRLGVLGLFLDKDKIEEYVKSNCILTHNSEESILTSIIFAKLVNHLLNDELDFNYIFKIMSDNENNEWLTFVLDIISNINNINGNNLSVKDISKKWTKDKGAYGYTFVTLSLSIYTFLINKNNYEQGLKDIISCGGDTDTNAFVYGLLSGTYNGVNNISKSSIELIDKKIDTENLFAFIEGEKEDFKINYLKLLLKNIVILPFACLEIFKRYIFILFKTNL